MDSLYLILCSYDYILSTVYEFVLKIQKNTNFDANNTNNLSKHMKIKIIINISVTVIMRIFVVNLYIRRVNDAVLCEKRNDVVLFQHVVLLFWPNKIHNYT